MSFIIQEIPQPTVFGLGNVQPTTGAGGTINFYAGEQDLLILEGNASSNWILNVEFDPTTSLDTAMQDDDVLLIEYAATIGATPYRQTAFQIDGTQSGIEISWTGTLPSAGTANAVDYYKYQIVKTFDNTYTVIGTFTPGGNEFGTVPSAPLGVSATTVSASGISVAFSAPSSTGGYPILNYEVISSPSAITATGSASPITVLGLTQGNPYTFQVAATNIIGQGALSIASNTAIPAAGVGQIAYISGGTYTFIPAYGVNSVSVVAVGSGGSGRSHTPANTGSGGGGGLGYKNNISVTPGNSYTVVVGPGSTSGSAGDSYFVSAGLVFGGGGTTGGAAATGGLYVGDGGGNGGAGGSTLSAVSQPTNGGGGAGGYAGNGGAGGSNGANGSGGSGGGGGGGAGGPAGQNSGFGGGVGILGQGPSGAAGTGSTDPNRNGGGGSGGTQGSGIDTFNPTPPIYGGGGGGGPFQTPSQPEGSPGGGGAVRIIWSGIDPVTRAFPSTNTGNL